MVDVVSSVSAIQSSALKPSAQNEAAVASAASTEVAASASSQDQVYVSSSIRVDNLQNVAILEYRSSSGQVVQQYPTQSQIDAFKRAEQIAEHAAETKHVQQGQPAPAASSAAPQPQASPAQAHQAASPTPQKATTGGKGDAPQPTSVVA